MRVLFLALMSWMGFVSNAWSSSPQERFCSEERAKTERWVLWAAEQRENCARNEDEIERVVCLREARDVLFDMHREHAQVYQTQVASISNDHPIMIRVLTQLNDNAYAAQQVIDTESDPASVVAHVSQACLNPQ